MGMGMGETRDCTDRRKESSMDGLWLSFDWLSLLESDMNLDCDPLFHSISISR